MSPTPLPLVVAALFGAAVSAQPSGPSHDLVVVELDGPADVQRLLALDLDLASCVHPAPGTRQVEVIAAPRDAAKLRQAGLRHRVAVRGLEEHYRRRLARALQQPAPRLAGSTLDPPLGQGSMGGHYTLAEMESILDDFARAFPAICSPKTGIGTSVEGRPLWMVKISDNVAVDEDEPEVLYDALHHAREPVSMEATLLFMSGLLEAYGSEAEATYLVDERELYFVPCVNPDGYEYNRRTQPGGGGLWRKNRRGGYGVDLNRNYATGFGGTGSSGSRSSNIYRGPAPFSEPETAAMEAFASQREFVQVFSTHTYTDVLLRAWFYRGSEPANAADYDRVGRIATARNRIAHGSAYHLLYPASGTALDHHHAAHGALAWTAELGRSNEGGFWPNPANTVLIAQRHQEMFRTIALLSGPELEDGELVLITGGTLGSPLEVGMLGRGGARAVLGVSAGRGSRAVPGIRGTLLLDPASMVALPPITLPPPGWARLPFRIPAAPSLRGATTWWQMLHLPPAGPMFGNLHSLTLR